MYWDKLLKPLDMSLGSDQTPLTNMEMFAEYSCFIMFILQNERLHVKVYIRHDDISVGIKNTSQNIIFESSM